MSRCPNCSGDRQAAEGALERNLLAFNLKRFYGIHPPFLTIRTHTHVLKITAILKLPKLPACPFSVIATQFLEGEGKPACRQAGVGGNVSRHGLNNLSSRWVLMM